MANKEQGGSRNEKKVAKLSIKEKRALKREKRAHKGGMVVANPIPNPSTNSQ